MKLLNRMQPQQPRTLPGNTTPRRQTPSRSAGFFRGLARGGLARQILLTFFALTGISLAVTGYVIIMGMYVPGVAGLPPLSVRGLYNQAIDTAFTGLTGDVNSRRIQYDDWVSARERDLYILSRDPEIQAAAATLATTDPGSADFRQAHGRLDARMQLVLGNEFTELFVTTRDGQILFSTLERQDASRGGQALRIYLGDDTNLSPFLTSPYYEANDPDPQLLVVQPVTPPTTLHAVALLGGRVSPAKLQSIVAGLQREQRDRAYNAYLVTRNEIVEIKCDPVTGKCLQNPRTRFLATLALSAGTPPEYSSQFISDTMHLLPVLTDQGLAFGCQTSGQSYVSFSGERVFGSSCAIPAISSALIVEQPESVVLQPLYVTLGTAVGLLAVLFFLILVVSLFMTRQIVNPIVGLTEMSSRVADGDFEQHARVNRRDELGQLATSFNRMTDRLRELYGGLEAIVARRTEQLRLAAEVSRTVSELRDVSTLLPQIVERVRERFEFYYVGLFLLDDAGEWAELRAGTGEPGRVMLERHHRLEVGGSSMIGWVCAHNQPRIALDVGEEAVRFSNPLLPETRSEVALPLRAAGRLVGALSVQSQRPAAFTEEDLIALQNLADQIATAIENARLYSEETRRAEQRRQAMDIARRASAEHDVDVLLQDVCDLTCETFGYYSVNIAMAQETEGTPAALVLASALRGGGHPLVGMTERAGEGLISHAMASGETVLVSDVTNDARYLFDDRVPETRCEMTVPLKLGDRVIGVLDVEGDHIDGLSAADQDLMQLLAGLVAAAIENARLYQQTSANLREMSMLYRQYTREAWRSAAATSEIAYEYAAPGVARLPAPPLPDLARAIEAAQAVVLKPDADDAPAPAPAPGRAGVAAPINLRGETIGALAVYDTQRERTWTQDELDLVQAASAEVALALENARLFRQSQDLLQTEQQRRQLADTLREVAEAVSSTLKIEELLNLILDQLQRVVVFDTASVQLLEGDELVIIGGRGFDDVQKVVGLRFPLHGDNPNWEVFQRRAPYIVADTQARYEHMRRPPHEHIRSWMGVPLVYGERLLGMLTLDSHQVDHFTMDQADLALAFANQAAAAITNARLFEETQRRAEQLATLNEIGRAVTSAQTFEQTLEVIYQQAQRVIPSDAFFIALYDSATQGLSFELIYDQGQRYPRSVSTASPESRLRRCLEEKRTIMLLRTAEEMEADADATNRVGDASRPSASFLYTPLLLGDRAIGAISAQSYRVNAYTQEHADLIGAMANQAAAAVQNARLFEETQRHAEQVAKLNEISRAVSTALTLEQVLETIYTHTGRLIETEGFFVALYDQATDRFAYELIYDGGERFPREVRSPAPGSNVRLALEQREPLMFLYAPEEMEERRATQTTIGSGKVPASLLYAPLIMGDEALGVISTQTYKFNSYTSVDRELLAAIANQTAAAVRNVRLLEETQRRATQFATLNEISRAVSSSLTLEQVLEVVYRQTARVIPAEAFYVALYERDRRRFVFELLYDEGVRYPREQARPTESGGLERAFETRRPVLIQYSPEEAERQAEVKDGYVGADKLTLSQLFVPLMLGDEAIGVMSAQTYQFNSYTAEHQSLLDAIAAQASAAIQNARLFEEAQRRAQEMAVLNEVGRAVNSVLSLDDLYRVLHEQVGRLMDAESFYVALYEPEKDEIVLPYVVDEGLPQPTARRRRSGLTGYVIEHAAPLLLRTAQEREALSDVPMVGAPSECYLGVPLIYSDRPIGMVAVQHYQQPNVYDDDDVRVLLAVAQQAAAAIQNARLFEETQRRAQEMATLNDVTRAVTSVLSLEELYQVLHQQVTRLMDANSFYIAFYDATTEMVSIPYMIEQGRREPRQPRSVSRGLTGYVIRTRQALNARENVEALHAQLGIELVGNPTACWLGVPMFLADEVLGVIAVQSYEQERLFDEHHERILQAIANQAAIAIQNTRLFEQTQRRAEELSSLYELGSAVSGRLEFSRLSDVTFEQVLRLTGAATATLVVGPDDEHKITVHTFDRGKRLPVIQTNADNPSSLVAHIVRAGKALLVRDLAAERERLPVTLAPPGPQDEAPRSWLGLPLQVGDRTIGALTVEGYEPGQFNEGHERLLRQVSAQVAIALENARLFESSELARRQAEERLRESVALQAVSRAVSRTLALNEVLDIVLEQIIYTLGFEFSVISLVDDREGVVKAVRGVGVSETQLQASRRPLDDRDIMADIVRTGKTEVIDRWDDRFDKEMFERERHFELSRVFTPIVSRGRNIGLVEAGFHKANRAQITEQDVRLLQAFVDQAAIGIENARLFAETERRAVQLSTASDISRAATSILDPDQLVREAVNLIRERFNFYYVAVFLLDEEGQWAHLREATGEAGRVLKDRGHKLEAGGNSMVGWVVANQRARIALDVGAEAVRFVNPLLPDTRSEIALPLRVGDRVVGALDVQSVQAGAFSPEDIDVLQSMSDQLATTLENARLFQESISRAREVTALFEASQQLSVTLELEGLFDVVARRLMEATRAQAATVSEFEQDSGHIVTRASVAATPDKVVEFVGTSYVLDMYPLRHQALTEAQALALRLDDPEHAGTQELQLLRRSGMRALLLLPLTVRERVLGLIALYDDNPHRRFGPDEIRFASTLVNQAAVAIQNARLFAETQTALAETATLYQAGRAISAAGGPPEVLAAIMDNVAPPAIDRVVLMLFGDERRPDGMPELIETVAAWGPRAPDLPRANYTPESAPFLYLTNPYAPVTIDDIRIDPRIDQRSRGLLNQLKIRSMCGIPLTVASSNRWIGLMLVHTIDPHTHRFDEREVRLYHTLAAQAAVQLDRVRAESSLARRVNQLAASAEVSRAAASVLDLDGLLAQSVELIRDRFNYYHVQVFLLEEPGHALRLRASTGDVGRRLLAGEQPVAAGPDTLIGWVVANRRARVATDAPDDPLYRPHPALPDMRAELAIPLSVGDKVLGALDIQSEASQGFGPEDVTNLSSLADQVGVAISNAQLFLESQQRIAELGLLFDVTKAATSVTRLEDVLQRSAETLHAALDRAQVAIFLAQDDELQAGATAGYAEMDTARMTALPGQGVVGWVAETGQPAVIGDVLVDTRYREVDPRTRSELAVPLVTGQQVIGVLNVESPHVEAFGQEHLRLLTTLSTTLAAVIQTARLFEEIQAANVRLREVDRLKSEFLASMSHELRTPLNSIIGFSRVILKGIDGPLTELQTTDLTAIHASGQHLLGLINDILDLSKIEAGKLELAFDEVDFREIIKSVMPTFAGLTKDKAVELRQEVPPGLPTVWGDQMRLRQIIINLLSNAAKFTDQGSITIRAELIQDRPLRAPENAPVVDFVRISVIDTGIGIAEKDLPKLFKQFQQVDSSSSRRAGGTGLGLNITKTLVELQGGRIGLSSVYGRGSTFWFTVPTRPYERQAQEAAADEGGESQPDGRRVVLAIDDDPGVITLYRRYLEPQGFRVVGVNRSDEVMDKARELKPYVITLDVLMPHRDGWQVIQDLKDDPATRDIPVIMASIVADQGRGFSLGAADYLVKPILEQDLLAVLKRLDGEDHEATVLVIDDEVANIRLVKRVLEGDAHYRVLEACSGREGLEAVQTLHPDIIVLDLMMPEMDGFDVLATLKSDPEMRDIPVIVVTAKDLTEEDRERLNGHVGSLLRKGPLTESELLEDVVRVLRRAGRRERAQPEPAP